MSLTISRQYKQAAAISPNSPTLPADTIHLMANIAIKQRSAKFLQLMRLVMANFPSHVLKQNSPLATFNKRDPSRIITFPNIPMPCVPYVGWLVETSAHNTFPRMLPRDSSVIHPFSAYLQSEMEDSRKALKWQSTPRAFKTINKKQTLSMERWLRSIILPSAQAAFSDAIIRDTATTIVTALRPSEFHIAETPDDFMYMYENGPRSCMLSRIEGAASWAKIMTETKLHPTSFYAFCPEIVGAYIQQDKQVLARTLLYKVKGEIKFYGRVFSATGAHDSTLTNIIVKKYPGIRQLRDDEFGLTKSFEIPIVKANKSEYCAIPYTDNLRINLLFKRTGPTKMGVYPPGTTPSDPAMFNVPDETYAAFDTRNAGGFIPVSHLTRSKCANCGTVASGSRLIHFQDLVWCGEKCMEASGYIRAFNAAGQRVVRPSSHCLIDPLAKGYAYTTRKAAKACGAKPYLTDLKQLLEYDYRDHPVWTMQGNPPFLFNREYYILDKAWTEKYVRKSDGTYITRCGRFVIKPTSGSWSLSDNVDPATMELKKSAEIPVEEPLKNLTLAEIFDTLS